MGLMERVVGRLIRGENSEEIRCVCGRGCVGMWSHTGAIAADTAAISELFLETRTHIVLV